MRPSLILACATLFLGSCATGAPRPVVSTQSAVAAEQEVRAAAAAFASAFNALDAARFNVLWAVDASVFFPQPPFPIRRIDGKANVLAWFGRFMDAQRKAGRPPGVDPKDLQIQLLGTDSAIVSFHLGTGPDAVARRTLVYRREAGGWRIVHLHASSLSAPKP